MRSLASHREKDFWNFSFCYVHKMMILWLLVFIMSMAGVYLWLACSFYLYKLSCLDFVFMRFGWCFELSALEISLDTYSRGFIGFSLIGRLSSFKFKLSSNLWWVVWHYGVLMDRCFVVERHISGSRFISALMVFVGYRTFYYHMSSIFRHMFIYGTSKSADIGFHPQI